MDRLRISGNVPAELAERLSDNGIEEFSAEDLRDARLEIEEELAAGKRIGTFDLEAIIEVELNRNYDATIRNLYEHFAGIGTDGGSAEYDRCMRAGEWMLRLIRQQLDTPDGAEIIEERAAQIAADRLEDA